MFINRLNNKKKWFLLLAVVAFLTIVTVIFFSNFGIYKNILNDKDVTVFFVSKKAKPQKQDIVLFFRPFKDKKIEKFSRCIATPGEIIELKNTDVFINDKLFEENSNISKKYRVNCFSEEANNRLLNKYKLIDSINILGLYFLDLTQKQIDLLKNDSIIFIRQIIIAKGLGNNDIFPYSNQYRWNEDNFGPLTIPYKGYKIELNKNNFLLYKNTIIYFENKQIIFDNEKYIIDGKECNDYTFENDYYFVMNDNRSNFSDSRMWGILPKYKIKGIVTARMFP